jgi:centrosomal protein CEP290
LETKCERYEDDIREYGRQIQTYRDEKFARKGDEQGLFREKINQKNKLITELEDENAKLLQDNLNLNKLLEQNKQFLQDSTFEMNKTRDDIRKLKLLQQHNDSQVEQLKKENDILKSQIEILNSQILSHQSQDDAIMNAVDTRVKEFKVIFILFD